MDIEFIKNLFNSSFKKFFDTASLPSVGVAILTLWLSGLFKPIDQAFLLTLIVFGFVATIEFSYRNRQAHFNKVKKQFEDMQLRDHDFFMALIEKLHGNRIKPFADKFELKGLRFNNIQSDKPVPTTAIGGPLCPECEGRITIRAYPFFPWFTQYSCACGFECLLKETPDRLYNLVKNKYHLLE